MKKIIITLLSITFFTSLCVFSIENLNEPSTKYMENLKTCTPINIKDTKGGLVREYVIKGKLSDGRCHVLLSEYTNFADPQIYKDAIYVLRAFAESFGEKIKDSDIPTQEEMIKKEQKEKFQQICKFSPEQRKELYNAYLKHDGKPIQGKVERDKVGNITKIRSSWSTDNMSSYDKLMMNYSAGTCEYIDNN